jgi:glycosyltransferase involved in cell wall biosynthesis
MSVFAPTSRSVGMPLAVLEAWAAGVPVVATRVGGVPELIEDGRTGLLVPSGEEILLTGAIDRVLANRELAGQLAEAGRRRVLNEFDVAHLVRDYERQYLELLGRKAIT